MKKIILLITIILCCTFLFTGCSSKHTSIDVEQFKKIAEENDLTIIDSSEQFSDDEKVDNVIIGYNVTLQLEFYNMKKESFARDMFESNKQTFSEEIQNTSSEVNESGSNYEMYSLITTDEYMYVERRDNTVFYLRVPVTIYEEAHSLIEKFK